MIDDMRSDYCEFVDYVNVILYVILLYEKTIYKLKLEVTLNPRKSYFQWLGNATENKHILFSTIFLDHRK
jgi:hypothetical protein